MNTLITEFVVTEQCNLDCEYCYMKDNNVYMDMSKVHLYIKNVGKIMEQYGCSQYHISYFGGEPLMNWEVVKEAIQLFNKDPRCNSQVIITNGLLFTEEIIDFCQANRCGFSWSFDGMWQDENRPHKSIQNTLDIYRQKKDLILSKVGHGCKVMIAPQNIDTMTENLEFLIEEFDISNPDYSIVRDDIWSPEDLVKFKIECRRLADRVIKYFHDGRNVSAGFFVLALMDMINGSKRGKRPFGCFAGCHGVGYFPNGDFYPCARFGSHKQFILLDKDGELYYNNIKTLLNPKVCNPKVYPECQNCELYNFCNAGCTFSQLKLTESGEYISKPVESVCDLVKMIYNDTLYIHDVLKDLPNYQNYIKNLTDQLQLTRP